MPLHIVITPVRYFVSPVKGAQPKCVKASAPQAPLPKGSYQVIPEFGFKVEGNANSTLAQGSYLSAQVKFFARQKMHPSMTTAWTLVGTLDGVVTLEPNAAGTFRPVFYCNNPPGSSSIKVGAPTFLKRESAVEPSDFILYLREPSNSDTLKCEGDSINWRICLPWIFEANSAAVPNSDLTNPPLFQLCTDLTVNGNPESDVTSNTPLDIPMKHSNVYYDDGAESGTFSAYGVRSGYYLANARLSDKKVTFSATSILNVYIDDSIYTINTMTDSAISTAIKDILGDAGFDRARINVSKGNYTNTTVSTLFVRHNGICMSSIISDVVSNPTEGSRRTQVADNVKRNNPPDFLNATECSKIPFFDFYVFAEDRTPADGGELGAAEIFDTGSAVGGIAAGPPSLKYINRPITFITSKVRNLMDEVIEKKDWEKLTAVIICHEIGHSFGLRHGLTLDIVDGTSPECIYDLIDNAGLTCGVMNWLGTMTIPPASTKASFPVRFFGPVHKFVIKRYFLP